MDSETSLIEISAADDSLLLQPIPIPSDDVDTGATSLDNNYFPCSPLQLLDGSEPSLSSGVVDEENIGVNKFVTQNLGADSLQRKRKNRRCGYNLRKSLAWNRAFLTEEGVLDPTELSIISGNPNDVMRDKFSVIHEDVKELSHENSVSPSFSENLPAFEEKLFQKLPRVVENEGQSASRSSTNTHLTMAKPTRIQVKRRVLAAQDVNSGRSKQSNGQSVIASSSLKRAASSNTANVGCIDLKKVSKSRTANPDLGLHLCTTNTMPSSGYINQTQNVKPDTPAGRNVRMKRVSGNAAGPQRNVTGSTPTGKPLTDKSTTRQASRNMDNPQSRMNTLPVKNRLKPPIKPSSRNEVGSASKGVSLVEKAELVKGKIQHLLVQRAEPTGLRMPSPSISFFDQPRASALRRPIMPAQLCNAFPPVSSNMMDLQRIGCADTMMFAPVQKMMPTPDIKSESNVKWINSNAKTSEGCSLIPRQREDLDDACYDLKSFLQLDVKEMSIRPKFPCLQKEACKNLREDINQSVCDVHLKDEIATYGNNTTGCIGTVTDTKAREECTSMSCADHGAFSLPNPKYFSSPSSCLPSTGILNHSYCADDDREVYQSQNNSFLGDCNQTFVNQCPERYDRTTSSLSSPSEKTDVVIPAHLCGCEDDDGLDGLPKTGGQLDSEDEVNGSSSSSFKVEIGMASLTGDRCFIIADDVNGGSMEQLKDSSSNSEQPFFMTSYSDDLSKGNTGHKIPSEQAPASMDGDVGGGPNSFSAPSHMTSDKTGGSEEDEQATSPCMGSGDAAANGKGKYEINLLKAGDILDSIATTILEEPTDVSSDHIRTPQSISEPALLKEGAEDHQLTLTACCSAASQLQSIDGSINSNQTALLVQVDSSHLVGVHLDNSHMIHDNLYVESQLERAFDELATSASADGNITVATSICVETESETKIEILDYATIDDSLSCEKGSFNVPDRVKFDELALVSVEYEALDCLHWPGNQQMSSPNVMLSDKPANEENPTETQPNKEKNSSSLVSNMEMNDEPVVVALGVPSLQEPEIGSATHGSENRIEIPVAVSHLASSMRKVEDTGDDLAKCLSVDAPLQASASDDVEVHISSASNIVQEEPESSIKTGEPNDSTPPTDNLDKYQNQDHVVGKPPADSIPYSDEWLAAIEAAGEDILKMKSGAVQNSPPERSEPEPSQWSPVRRKNNQAIGPFDCTKFINASVPLNSP